jgi:two-component system, OmpR family, response regulator ResD
MKAGSQCILCADDNPYFRHFVSRFLTDYGCEVVDVATASEALSLVRERPDDYDLLIVADWLPDMDGVELFQALRSIPYAGRIVITAPNLMPYRKATYEALGASSFLITPVGYSDVLRILEPPRTGSIGEHRADQPGDATSGRAPDSSVQ